MKTKIRLKKEDFELQKGRYDIENSFHTFFKNKLYTVVYKNIDKHYLKANWVEIIEFIEEKYKDDFNSENSLSNLTKEEGEYIKNVLKLDSINDYNNYQNARSRIIRKKVLIKKDNYQFKKDNIEIQISKFNNLTISFKNITRLPDVLIYKVPKNLTIESVYDIIDDILLKNEQELDKLLRKSEFIKKIKNKLKEKYNI